MENKIKFNDIQKANEEIKSTTLKNEKTGKVIGDYVEVNQRVKAFRMIYPTGSIITEMISNENGVCIFKADVYDENEHILATGTAYEKEDSTFINRTSYIENCETSAVGRALGLAGFGIDSSIASKEEVQNAVINQEAPVEKKATEGQLKVLNKLSDKAKQKVYDKYGVDALEDLTIKQASELIGNLMKKQEEEPIEAYRPEEGEND